MYVIEACLISGAIIVVIALIMVLMTGVKIIRPYEQGLQEVLGSFKRRLNPGFNFVIPLVSRVMKIDLRTQTLDVPKQEVITKDNSPTFVDAVIYIKVNDAKKAYYEVDDFKKATIYLAQTTLRSVIGDMELDDVLSNRDKVNLSLRDILDNSTDPWGVKVVSVEIREVDPAREVKRAMEHQTSAEREKRATILRAEGSKRGAILSAEGSRQSKILTAEGIRQSKILVAEGERTARMLEAQGEAQKLRILSLGSATLDQKSLTVLSLDAVKSLAEGQATKIVLPFEITRLLEGVSEYIGSSRKIPEHKLTDLDMLQKRLGNVEKVLGDIPSSTDLIKDAKNSIENISSDKPSVPLPPSSKGHVRKIVKPI